MRGCQLISRVIQHHLTSGLCLHKPFLAGQSGCHNINRRLRRQAHPQRTVEEADCSYNIEKTILPTRIVLPVLGDGYAETYPTGSVLETGVTHFEW